MRKIAIQATRVALRRPDALLTAQVSEGLPAIAARQRVSSPPSIVNCEPVTKRARSDAKKRMAWATSFEAGGGRTGSEFDAVEEPSLTLQVGVARA